MAKTKIRGITIELGADYKQVTDAFKAVSKELSSVDKSLKDVNKLLKLDPSNVELLSQKQKYLQDAIKLANDKLEEEQKMLDALPSSATGELTDEQMALAREIEATKIQLTDYEKQLADVENTTQGTAQATEQADKATEDYGKQSEKTSTKLAKLGSIVSGLRDGLDLFMGALKVGKQIYDEFIGDTVKLADDLMVQAQVTGLSTDALQEYSYMAELVDTDVETITGSMTKMVKNMATATKGTGDAYNAFQKLGVAITDDNGEMRDQNEVFADVIQALGQMTNETERDALAMQIFGKSAKELNPLIEAGADSIEEYRQQAHEMGYVLDGETLQALGNVDDTIQMLKNTFDTVKKQIATALLPIVEEITTAFLNWAQSVDWQEVGRIMKAVFDAIGKAIKVVIPIFEKLIEIVGWVIDKVKALFSMKFEIPKIKLPHIALTPRGWKISDLLSGTIPKLSIDWYAKGYDGMVLDGATIFGMNKNGQLMGGGEKGREIIIGEDKLASMLNGKMVINVTVNEANNAEATAQAVMNRMQLAVASEGRMWQ